MKTGRFLVLLVLVLGLLAGPWQAPAEAEMLGRPGQFKNLYYNNTEGKWYETKPDGTSAVFSMGEGQTFIMTMIAARFYVSGDPALQPGPYRFYLLGTNSSRLYINNLTDIKYPGSETVWGGGITDTLTPGAVFAVLVPESNPPRYVLPTPQVKQLPEPPTSPNEGPVRSGTFYITVRGYTLP